MTNLSDISYFYFFTNLTMKKTSLYASVFVSALALSVSAQTKNIAFEHVAFKDLKAKAAKENKLIFVDAYTTWCGPCKYMAKNIFTNDTVADFYNANFVNAKIDMEKGEGVELAKQYEVMCYPNLLFIDGNGNIVHRVAGSMNASEFVKLGKQAMQKEGTFSYYKSNYESQKNNSEFLVKYIEMISGTCLEPSDAVTQYFSLQKESDLTSKANWGMIQAYVNDMNSKEFMFLTNNKKKFDELYSEQSVNEKIDDVHFSSLMSIVRAKQFDEAKYKSMKDKITASNSGNVKRVIFEADLKLAQKNKDWASYAKLAVANVDEYYKDDAGQLNGMAWTFYENVSDKQAMLKAEEWAKRSTELNTEYANLDTYASVLYKNGKKAEALAAANKAIDKAKQDGMSADDYKDTSALIGKIKAMK